jgi:ubiquitin
MAKLTKEDLAKMIKDEVQAAVAALNPKSSEQQEDEDEGRGQ